MSSSTPRSLASAMIQRQQQSVALLMEKFYRISEVSVALDINKGTLLRWVHEGRVAAVRTGKGRWRISEKELLRLQGKVA